MQLILTGTLRVALSELMAQLRADTECDTIAIAISNDGCGAIMLNGIPMFHLYFGEDCIQLEPAHEGVSVRAITQS